MTPTLPGYDHPIWWVVGIAIYVVGVLTLMWVATLDETAAGDGDSPADGTAPTAGSSMTAAAPAPTAPDPSAGAVGVTPDDAGRDRREAEQAAEITAAFWGGGR